MGSNKKPSTQISQTNIAGKQSNLKNKIILLVLVVLVTAVLGFSFLSNGKATKTGTDNTSATTGKLKIQKSEISSEAKFYPYEADGIRMEVMAIKAEDGSIRTALNTCQVCYSSGRGYYVQDGKEVVCQNCGNRFDINAIGEARNGCNPIPIPEEYKSDDGANILIEKAYLDQNKALFENWKTL